MDNMDNIKRKPTERINLNRQVQYNKSDEHEGRIRAHEKKVKREYFDSGLYKKEISHHYPGTICPKT